MSRRQLSSTIVPEDETGGPAHQKLQEKNKRRLSHLQTAHCFMLLSCQTLSRDQMSSAILCEHKIQTQTTATATEVGLL